MSTDALSRINWTPAFGGHVVEAETVGASGGVDDHCIELYRYAVVRGEILFTELAAVAATLGQPVHRVVSAAMQLVELRLLRTDGGCAERLVPVDPQYATTLLISPIERAIYQQRELADQLRERIDVIAGTRDSAGCGGSIDRLEGVAELRGLLKQASDVCRDEVVVLRPGHDDNDVLDRLLDACYRVLDRGVTVRLISPHRSRVGFAARAKAKRLIDSGAAIRTISQVPQASVVFDRSLAVVFGVSDDGLLPTGHRVRDANVVCFLVEMFDQLWEGAAPLTADEEVGYADEVADDLQRSIALLMAQGLTDEAVARRLGMSVRTCRRHIAALLRSLGSVSRFQAGVQAATRFAAAVGGP
jgi:DNA-binding CsgD family transcriptional regulator